MKQFSAGIDIAAPPEAVWSALVDTASWPAFDPYSERMGENAGLSVIWLHSGKIRLFGTCFAGFATGVLPICCHACGEQAAMIP